VTQAVWTNGKRQWVFLETWQEGRADTILEEARKRHKAHKAGEATQAATATLHEVAKDWHASVAKSAGHRSSIDALNLIEFYLGKSKWGAHPFLKMDKPEYNALFKEVDDGALKRAQSHGKITPHTGKAIANKVHSVCQRP
jgi:hypothetical protein